jgi:hypothetical protein
MRQRIKILLELIDSYQLSCLGAPGRGRLCKRSDRAMLDRLIDSSQRDDPGESGRVRLLGETFERRLWIAAHPARTGRVASLCLQGGALGGTALIAAPVRRLSGWVADVIGQS